MGVYQLAFVLWAAFVLFFLGFFAWLLSADQSVAETGGQPP